jgi:hypothetical protein
MSVNQNISATPCAIRRIIQFREAVVYQPIQIFDNFNNDVTASCQYAWSTDGACWSPWATYTQYQRICQNIGGDFYLRILIFGGLSRVLLNGELTDCYNICLDTTSQFLYDFCSNPNLFQPFGNLDCALLLQQQMTNTAICLFGIPVYYLRVLPQNESADYTFKEWVLHNVVDVKQLKMIVPDGAMPSSNPKLTEFDFDWETDWEVQIGKAAFAGAFGDEAYPKQRDLVYVPLMKRLWEVNSAYDEKNEGLLWRPTTWHLAMVKYNEKTNVDLGNFDSLIDGWVENKYEDVFGEFEENEQERESGAPQVARPEFAATNLYDLFTEDAIRSGYTKDSLNIIDNILCHHNNIVSHNFYKPLMTDARVEYQKPICGDEGVISFIINTNIGDIPNIEKTILDFGRIKVNASYNTGELTLSVAGDSSMSQTLEIGQTYMIVITWDYSSFSSSFSIYKQIYDTTLPPYKVRPELYWFDFENPICNIVSAYNDDWRQEKPQKCGISPYPVFMTNIKYYNRVLRDEELYKELVKYSTNDERCVINDLSRPILSGHGYAVR